MEVKTQLSFERITHLKLGGANLNSQLGGRERRRQTDVYDFQASQGYFVRPFLSNRQQYKIITNFKKLLGS